MRDRCWSPLLLRSDIEKGKIGSRRLDRAAHLINRGNQRLHVFDGAAHEEHDISFVAENAGEVFRLHLISARERREIAQAGMSIDFAKHKAAGVVLVIVLSAL